MMEKVRQLFCRHQDRTVVFGGVRRKDNQLVRTIFSECDKCGKVIIYDKPKNEYKIKG